MKKILFILLLVSNYSWGQISINKTFFAISSASTDETSLSVLGKTYTAGNMYVLMVSTTGTTNNGTLTTTSTTWSNIINSGNSTRRTQIFVCQPTSTASGEDVTIGSFGGGSTGWAYTIWEVTGGVAIGNITSGSGSSADPSLTLGPLLGNGESAVVAFFTNGRNIFDGTVEAGWTQDYDNGYFSPETGNFICSRLATTDNTVVVTSPSADWAGVAFEIRTLRRVTLIN